MLHFVSVLEPTEQATVSGQQKPFFGSGRGQSVTETDKRRFDGRRRAEAPEQAEEGLWFSILLSPPFL